MTLERHRSKLIPTINLEADGKLSIGPSMGKNISSGLRHMSAMDLSPAMGPPGAPPDGGMTADDHSLPINNNVRVDEYSNYSDYRGARVNHGYHMDESSYRSYDPQRDARRAKDGKFKGKRDSNAYRNELSTMPGTWGSKSSGSQSIQRKLRKAREKRISREMGGPNSTLSTGRRRRRGGTPQISQDNVYPGSLNRTRATRTIDLKTLKKAIKEDPTYANGYIKASSLIDRAPGLIQMPIRNKKIVEEKLPAIIFIVLGCFLGALGIVHLLISWWHLYGCTLWTAALLLLLGIMGLMHKGDYLTKSTNVRYMVVAALTTVASLITVWWCSKVAIEVVIGVAGDAKTKVVAHNVTFTNRRDGLAFNVDVNPMLWVSLSTELSSIVICFFCMYALSAFVMCLDNHWEAVYTATSLCDHRGHPRYFNPIEQMSLGHLSVFVGIISMLLIQADVNHYYVPVWSGAVACFTGFISLCQGKRNDLSSLSMLAMFLQLASMAACSGGIVVMTLILVDDLDKIQNKALLYGTEYGERIASAVFSVLFLLIMMANLIIAVGVAFRICRKNWCGRVFTAPPPGDNISIA